MAGVAVMARAVLVVVPAVLEAAQEATVRLELAQVVAVQTQAPMPEVTAQLPNNGIQPTALEAAVAVAQGRQVRTAGFMAAGVPAGRRVAVVIVLVPLA